jgi:hypothetical protein
VRELGYRAVQVGGASVVHLDRLTKKMGGSTLTAVVHEGDTERFFGEYPHLKTQHGIWGMKFWRWPMATTRRASVLWWLSQRLPQGHARAAFAQLAFLLEPLATRYPARRGGGRRRPAREPAPVGRRDPVA